MVNIALSLAVHRGTERVRCWSDVYVQRQNDMPIEPPSKADFEGAKQDACGPANFCTFKDGACGCKADQQSASFEECDNACKNWSTKDIRCPKVGCYGFAFTLPEGFRTDDTKGAPNTKCFAKNDDWDIGFAPPDPKGPGAGSCDYGNNLPGPAQFCTGQEKGLPLGNGMTGTANQR